ncbi:uncharacterized protein [Drosophila virilis]|uniref:Uncharacterized protein n=1 Tax=Drosophila virilis TaxID=7244 RepID=B4LJC3_DROVI|nr:uncharacterized protein LOC6626747 [Drosophila virilis]EDW60503.2 uncharacterized protein Dvir_GJ20824 [Drosophila virilis]
MAHKRVKTEDMEVNYKFACRCCLKSEAEFFKLDSLIECGISEHDASSTKIPLIRLLLFCMRTENQPELPQYICVECSKSLQIAYYFIQNGLRAHEILCRKLCPGKLKTTTRSNGQHASLWTETNARDDASLPRLWEQKPQKSAVRHECKVCGAIVYNRMELKQHIRMHTESSQHQCKLCNFVTLKHRQLPEHYRKAHGLTAAQIEQQIKIRRSMQAAATTSTTTNAIETPADDGQVKVCTLEDMELLIPTVLTPEDFTHPQLDADQLRDIEQQLANALPVPQSNLADIPADPTIDAGVSANVSIGAEFLVMPDGSLQQVNDAGVVFEYIDDSKNTNTTTNMTLQSLLGDSKTDLSYNAMDIDLSHMVVDNALPQITVKPKPRPAPASTGALKHKCKLCPKAFPTVARLKSHQLTHSHLPKFYCDQCSYYSLRSADLIQHYTTEHKSCISESRSNHLDKALLTEPADRSRIYSCDMCLFEAPSSGQLRVHYSEKHLIVPSEVQLRPNWTYESKDRNANSTLTSGHSTATQLDIPLGIKYPPMTSATGTATSSPTATIQQPPQATTTTVVTQSGDINVVVDATSLFYAAGQLPAAGAPTTGATDSETFAIFPEQSFANSLTTSTITGETNGVAPATVSSNPNTSIFGDMQDFIDNTDVAAICTIPADDMPVVDGDDIVIDNNNISLDFDAENLFEDFEDVEVGEEDDDDEDDAENDDENDNNDAAADQNLLLTSDDDDVDDFDDEQSKHLQKPYCIYCNKKFTSQYKFENHMFVHRGLAPYRCELCTNLYNMKRLLIRHYKTVHKRMPTRDMVQAKGDKVSVPRTTIEKISVYVDKPPTLMCAKCPFECEQEGEMRKHLNAHHGINDGVSLHANEVFIIRKLPYDCPRCIRSFAAKRTLTRHLQRSHLVDTIIEMQAPQLTTSSASTTTTPTATTTLPLNASDGNKTTTTTTMAQQDSSMLAQHDAGNIDVDVDGDGDGDGKCDRDIGFKTEILDTDLKVEATTTMASQEKNADTTKTTSAETEVATRAKTEATEDAATNTKAISTTTSEAGAASKTTTTTAGSTLFPTPTPFDYDFDFIGSGANATSNKSNNDSFNIAPSPSHLLNGSDKLLTAALEPSPIKDLRSRLPRTPIFVCKQCNQTFDELGKLLQHELEQHSSSIVSPRVSHQHQCKICKTTYRTVTLLNYHMKRHAPAKVPCQQCPKENSPDLDQHIQSDHSANTTTPLKCGVDGCEKTFNYKHHLKRHQTASHTPVHYICPECGRDMLTSLHLRNHMSIHKGTHSYKCPKCVRTYMRRKPFRRHALREHKWELTEEEIDKIYSINDTPPSIKLRQRRSAKIENENSD